MKTFTHEKEDDKVRDPLDELAELFIRESLLQWCRVHGVDSDLILRDYNENI